MKTLKEDLGDLLTPELEAILVKREQEFIPKFKVTEMVDSKTAELKASNENLGTQIKTLEETITARDKDLKDLKKAAEGNAELTNQITELQNKSKEQKEAWEKEKQSLIETEATLKKALALKEHLLNSGVGDPAARDLLSKNFDLSKVEVDADGKIKGFEDLIKPIKESAAFKSMFGEEVIAGQRHQQTTVTNNGNDFYTREQVKAMDVNQVSANLEKVNKSMEHWDKQ